MTDCVPAEGVPAERARLVRWSLWFALVQVSAVALLSARYLAAHGWPHGADAAAYVLSAWLAQSGLLALVPWALLVLPLALLWPHRRSVQSLAVVVGAGVLAFVLIDSLVYAQDRFHIDALSARILGLKTWTFAAVYFAVFLGC